MQWHNRQVFQIRYFCKLGSQGIIQDFYKNSFHHKLDGHTRHNRRNIHRNTDMNQHNRLDLLRKHFGMMYPGRSY